MKHLLKIFAALVISTMYLSSCDKADDLKTFGNGTAPALSASLTSFAPAATDSLKKQLVFFWTDPNYSNVAGTSKYIVEIDSATKNFAHPQSRTVIGKTMDSVVTKDMNTILLNLGFQFTVPGKVEVRIKSSYGNNNEKYTSNTLTISMTAYKIPPILALPTTQRLFITGDATDFNWTNPAPMPAERELTRMDETTWEGFFHLSGGGEYLLLPLAGDWNNKYSLTDADYNSAGIANGGNFGFNNPKNFKGGITGGAGWYRMTYNFQNATFQVANTYTPFGTTTAVPVNPLATDLWITGDATPSSWVNNPPAAQKFTQKSNGVYEIIMAFTPGKYYKFLDHNGQWQPQFGGSNAAGGSFGANYGSSADPDAIPTPATAGNYKITVNFHTRTYIVQ